MGQLILTSFMRSWATPNFLSIHIRKFGLSLVGVLKVVQKAEEKTNTYLVLTCPFLVGVATTLIVVSYELLVPVLHFFTFCVYGPKRKGAQREEDCTVREARGSTSYKYAT